MMIRKTRITLSQILIKWLVIETPCIRIFREQDFRLI